MTSKGYSRQPFRFYLADWNLAELILRSELPSKIIGLAVTTVTVKL